MGAGQSETALEEATSLTDQTGNTFLIKREDMQPVSHRMGCLQHTVSTGAQEWCLQCSHNPLHVICDRVWGACAHQVFSFKVRGAFNRLSHCSAAELERGVICASAGNHAQGVALAARTLVR